MKHSGIRLLFIILISGLAFTSCKPDKKSLITGSWKMSQMRIESYEQQQAMSQKQVAILQDSISKNTDTAKLSKFRMQLASVQKTINEFMASQDSSMKNNRWEFRSNGDFTASETDGEKNGTWSLDENKMLLSTIINKDTASVPVKIEDDTLTLQFDSLNYMKFIRVK